MSTSKQSINYLIHWSPLTQKLLCILPLSDLPRWSKMALATPPWSIVPQRLKMEGATIWLVLVLPPSWLHHLLFHHEPTSRHHPLNCGSCPLYQSFYLHPGPHLWNSTPEVHHLRSKPFLLTTGQNGSTLYFTLRQSTSSHGQRQ